MKNKGNIFIIILLVLIIALLALLFIQVKNNEKSLTIIEEKIDEITTTDNSQIDENKDDDKEGIITQDEIKKLDIQIEYVLDEVEIEYEVKSNGKIESEYKNTFTNQNLKGEAASKFIEDKLLDINYNHPESDVIDKVLYELSLDEGFSEFELEVLYKDNTKVDFEYKQR